MENNGKSKFGFVNRKFGGGGKGVFGMETEAAGKKSLRS